MPKGSQYLQQASDEIYGIDVDIFHGNDPEQHEYTTKRYEHIVRDNFPDILKLEPDIIHFTGHGSYQGIVFDDGELITPEQLRILFEGQKQIQLIFLNACYSENQVAELKKLSNIKYIVGIKKEIDEFLATDFAISFTKNTSKKKIYQRLLSMHYENIDSNILIKKIFYRNFIQQRI